MAIALDYSAAPVPVREDIRQELGLARFAAAANTPGATEGR